MLTSWYSVRVTLGTSMLWVYLSVLRQTRTLRHVSTYGRRDILELLAGEDLYPVSLAPYHLRPRVTHISGDQVDLGVTVLSSLGGRHVDDLAGSSLDENVTRLPERRALHAVIVSICSCR